MDIHILKCAQCNQEFRLKSSFGTRMSPDIVDKDTPPNVAVSRYTGKVEEEIKKFVQEMVEHPCTKFSYIISTAC